jgi:hypothetical protein
MNEQLAVTWPFQSHTDEHGLRLAAASGPDSTELPFFEGRLRDPQRTAALLLALGDVVQSRHHLPAAMLTRILEAADPLVTVGDGVLRFEGFSACCGCYARVDLLEDAYEADRFVHGTTNVDMGPHLRSALARLRSRGQGALTVSTDALSLTTSEEQAIEHRIPLPARWLASLLHTAHHAFVMTPRGSLSRAQALRLLASLPRQARSPLWLVPGQGGWRLGGQPQPEGLALAGPTRLRALEPLIRVADRVDLHAGPDGSTTAWVVHAGPARFTLMLTAEVWRGFSGEGVALSDLAAAHPADVARWRAELRWRPRLPDATTPEDRAALAELATQGLVGFDLTERAWFHRALPYARLAGAKAAPRLVGAERLLAAGAVQLDPDGAGATVQGTSARYRVDLRPQPATCTCRWYAETSGGRGPCKHALAAALALEAR